MVKVLENKIIDLDLLPGQAQIDLQRQFKEQFGDAKTVTAGQIAKIAKGDLRSGDGELKEGEVDIPSEMVPEEQRGVARTVVDGSGKVVGGLVGTVGGVLKGVGDTGANVVYDVGSGLGGIGTGLAGGLKGTAMAPFDAGKSGSSSEGVKIQDEAVAEEKKKAGPRKIEIRNGEKEKA